jgi:DNA-directed RNA polymerase specialized sigma24 family protein
MRDPDEFDAFYRDAGERLLLQTYALTGDLTAARSAVRDSFIVAWHHWRKVSRLDDPEAFVRPHAWRHAQRRHTARLWHRDKLIDPDVKATLDGLATLTVPQRKALLLTQLAAVSMPEMAREIGVPLEQAERELQSGSAQFALARDISASEIRLQFEGLSKVVSAVRFPRPPIVRRAGAARRRTHTTAGVVGIVAAFLVTGSLITDASGVRPTLDFHRAVEEPAPTLDAGPPEVVLAEENLLTAAQVTVGRPDRTWAQSETTDNSEGSGMLTLCQRERYADPRGRAALVRTFTTPRLKKQPAVSLVQATEASRSPRAARGAYRTVLDWFAGCQTERVQLLATRRVEGVGDRAMLLTLRSWAAPVETMTVGVAQTGRYVTTTAARIRDDAKPDVDAAARLLGTAVDGLCTLPEAGACGALPRLVTVPPLPVGELPAILAELDLPPVRGVNRPWVGTAPVQAVQNPAATRCESATFAGSFQGAPFSNTATRTFVIPRAGLPARFGLTETLGALRGKRAELFVERVRTRLAACPDQDLGTDVTRVAHRDEKTVDASVWQLTTEISEDESVTYWMAVLRNGTAVAQLTFIPAGEARMAEDAFVAVVDRAVDRLGRLPAPDRG